MPATFSLPPCPRCSTTAVLHRPVWRFAHNTSAKRGRDTYAFVGCNHAAAIADPTKLRDDPDEIATVEDTWSEFCKTEFEAITATWTSHARAGFARALADRASFPGVTMTLDLAPGEPAQRQEPTNNASQS